MYLNKFICVYISIYFYIYIFTYMYGYGLGIRSFDFQENRSFFVQKRANGRFAPKNEQFIYLLIFGERPERFPHDRSFPLSDLSKSLMAAYFW